MNLTHRQKLILIAALHYLLHNCDDVNDAFALDSEDDEHNEHRLICVAGEVIAGIEEEEIYPLLTAIKGDQL